MYLLVKMSCVYLNVLKVCTVCLSVHVLLICIAPYEHNKEVHVSAGQNELCIPECAQSVHSVSECTQYAQVCTGVLNRFQCAQSTLLSTPDTEIRSKYAQYAQSVHKKLQKCTQSKHIL